LPARGGSFRTVCGLVIEWDAAEGVEETTQEPEVICGQLAVASTEEEFGFDNRAESDLGWIMLAEPAISCWKVPLRTRIQELVSRRHSLLKLGGRGSPLT
jgi:hypothetical protein